MRVMDSDGEKPRMHLDEVVVYFRKRIADWELYGKRSEAQAQRLIDRNKALTARIAELEGQLSEVVRQVVPHNRQLFQSRKAHAGRGRA
jgi:phosphoserine phosphatase